MKDGADNEKPDLKQTIECIGMMSQSLESLRERIYPQSPMWFAIMAQGPVDQIRDLLDDLEWLMKDMIPQELREQAAQLDQASLQAMAVSQEAA
jgi:hypothetical protein